LTLFLYILGTAQGFMDDTQFILLRLTTILGVLLAVSSILGLLLDLAFFLGNRKLRYLGGIFFHVFLGVFGLFYIYCFRREYQLRHFDE
jgi:hypothetical protein